MSGKPVLGTTNTGSFLDRALEQTPSFVVGIVGSFFGMSIAIIAVLRIGGLDVSFNRIVNAYATGIEASLTKIEKATDGVPVISERIVVLQTGMDALVRRMDRLDNLDVEQNRKLIDHESRITATEIQIRRLRGLP